MMLNFLKRIFMIGTPETKGEVVYGKLKDQVRPCYIPFSKDSGDNPVIATEQFTKEKINDVDKSINDLDARVKVLEGGEKPKPKPSDEKVFKDLFANKENGFLYDFNNLSGMFQDVEGKTPVTDVDQEVRKVLDASGNGNHLICADKTPKLAVNKNTGAYYLRFSGKEALWCEKHSIGKANLLTLITHITRDFKSTKGYEMYFEYLNTNMRMYCLDRSKSGFYIDRYLNQDKNVDSNINHNTLVGSLSLQKPELAFKVDDMWSKTSGTKFEATELPSSAIIVGNSNEARGGNGMVGGMYALIGVVKYWDDISLSPIEEVLKERSK